MGLLQRIALLLEEQNQLLREVHLAVSGRWPHTPPRSGEPPGRTRRRTAADVWQRTSPTSQELDRRSRLQREHAASNPSSIPDSGERANPAPPEDVTLVGTGPTNAGDGERFSG